MSMDGFGSLWVHDPDGNTIGCAPGSRANRAKLRSWSYFRGRFHLKRLAMRDPVG
jgi:hypothetical protein